ncbi:MAG: hypothetical protein V2A70_04935, partial [Candidatus Omnitrophota bacterium]
VEKMALSSNARNVDVVMASLTVSKMIVGADPSIDAKELVRARANEAASAKNAGVSGKPEQRK